MDQNFVRAAVPDGAAELLSFLPSLGPAETMVFGESVNLPMRVILNNLAAEYRPHSSSAQFTDLWKRDVATPELMDKVFDRWRARSLYPDGRPSEPVVHVPTVKDTRAALRNRAAAPQPHAARTMNQRAPAPTAQSSALAAQVRERLQAKASAAAGKPSGIADVKSMLNSAFHKNI